MRTSAGGGQSCSLQYLRGRGRRIGIPFLLFLLRLFAESQGERGLCGDSGGFSLDYVPRAAGFETIYTYIAAL